MAILSDAVRADLTAEIQRTVNCPGGISKAQLRAVFNALDDWWETLGATAANTAIPQPQRGSMTVAQKYAVMMLVLMKKVEGL